MTTLSSIITPTNIVTATSTTTLTNKTIDGANNTISNIDLGTDVTGTLAQSSLANSSLTVNGVTIALGGSNTVTSNAETLTGTSLNSTVVGSSLTSVGTLTSLSVTGNITGANIIGEGGNLSNIQGGNVVGAVGFASTANAVAGSNVSGAVGLATFADTANAIAASNVSGTVASATVAASANSVAGANVTGTVATATTAGTVTTAAQPNITSVGSLTSVTVSGNANVGNIGTTALVAAGSGSFGANVNMNSFNVNNLATPVANADAATKQYVDGLVSTGLIYHISVKAATTTTLAVATGGTITYNNGTSGVGANIVTTGSFTTIDTVSVDVIGTRILVKNESNAALNGVYTYANSTTIVRATDADTYGTGTGDLSENDYFFVTDGSVNKGTAHVCNTAGTITFGSTDITFAIFSTSQVYTAGTGLSLAGTEFSIANTTITPATYGGSDAVATFTVNQQGQLTAASNVAIQANAANLSGTSLNSSVVGSSLTSVGTLTSLNVSGNANVGNIGTAQVLATANVTTPQFISNITTGTPPLVVTSTTQVANLNVAAAGLATFATTANAVAGANVSGEVSFSATANAVAGANVSGEVNFAAIANTVAGANVTGTVASATTAGTVTTAAQSNITSVGTLTSLTVSGVSNLNSVGNIIITGGTTGQVLTTNGSGNLSFATLIPGGGYVFQQSSAATTWTINHNLGYQYVNIQIIDDTGNSWTGRYDYPTINFANSTTTVVTFSSAQAGWAALTIGSPAGSGTAGTVTENAQPNITSVGTLTTLAVSGVSNLNSVSNIIITGGTTGQVLTTNGSGNVGWTSPYSNIDANAFMAGGVVGDIIPAGNNVANLGSPTNQFKDLFLSNATLYFNGAGLTVGTSNGVANTLIFNSQPIVTSGGNTTLSTTGNVTGAYIVGNGSSLSSITGSNVTGTVASATVAASANSVAGANVTGTVASAITTGTVTTAAQPNITSVGTLTSLTVSGNANVGNLDTTALVATGTGSFGANVNMNSQWITNLGYPSVSTDAASKQYVDTLIATGISYHQPVAVSTTTTLAAATGGTTTYNSPNGAANGIGAYISTTGTYLNIDGANVQTVGTRILVKNEANATWNGIYTYANTTAIVRATDADTYGVGNVIALGINDYFFTTGGVVNEGAAFVVSAPSGTITFGTSSIVFSTFSTSQVYDAGTGLTLTGTTFSVNASQTQITSVGTLASLSVIGNISAGNVSATTFTGTLSGAATSATTAGTVTTAAQSNITSVGTLTTLAVSGVSNLNAVGNVIITGGTNGQYLQTNGSGNLVWATVAGGASSNISNGTSNVSIADSGGNVTVGVGGTANIIVASTGGANVTGNIGVTGNVTANNLSAGNIVVVGGFTITAVGTKLVFSYGGANIFSLNSTGNIIASNNVTAFGTP